MLMNIRIKVEEICQEYSDNGGVNSSLESLSSMKLFELVCVLEEEFGVEFCKDEITNLNNFRTIEKIVELIESKCVE